MVALTDDESKIDHRPRNLTETVNELYNDEDRNYISEKKKLYHPDTRLWVFKKVDEWLKLGTDEFRKQKVFWISGAAGTGKTVISAKLEDELGKEVVIAYYFCRHDLPKKNRTIQILLSLGKLISKNLDFEEPRVNEEDINSNNIDIVFYTMLEKPLNKLQKSPHEPRKVIILDALDEIENRSLQEFLLVITKYFLKLPNWVGIFITSRYQKNIVDELSPKFEALHLYVDEEKNLADLQAYILHLTEKYKINNDFQIDHLEREVEEKFNLQRNILSGKLEIFKHPIQLSLTIYNQAINELKEHEPDLESLIENIKVLRDPSLRQNLDNFEDLYKQAKVTQEKFGNWLKKTFSENHIIDPGVKGKKRCKEKIKLDYNQQTNRIRDISRFTMRFDTFQDLTNAYKKIQECKFANVVQVKNKFLKPDAMGNRDINLNIKVNITQSDVHICELQLNLNKMLQAKERCHGYYEETRKKIPEMLLGAETNIQQDEFERFITKRLHCPTIDAVVHILVKKSSGLFQYARLLEDTMEYLHKTNKSIEYDHIDALPTELNDMYQVNFDRVFSRNKKETKWEECEEFISLVCAAQEPLPKQIVMEILTSDKYNELQTKISVLFPEVNGEVKSIHKSIVNWLRRSNKIDENDDNCEGCFHEKIFVRSITDWLRGDISTRSKNNFSEDENENILNGDSHKEIGHSYCISESMIQKAHERLAGHCLNLLLPINELSSKNQDICHSYAMKYSILHALHSKNRNHLLVIRNNLLFNIEWLSIKIKNIGVYECLEDYMLLSSYDQTDRPVQLMKHALQLSLPALYKNPDHLCSQLLGGRLSMIYEKKPLEEIKLLLNDLNEYMVKMKPLTKDKYCWKPSTQFLTPAGNPCEMIMTGHANEVHSVLFSPDGKHIASGSADNTIRIWDVLNGKCEKVLEGHTGVVWSVSFSPDGNQIASGSGDETVIIWNVVSGKCEKKFEEHTDHVRSVSFSPDGKQIVSGGIDKTVRIWDVVGGKCEKVLKGHTRGVHSVSFSPNGKQIASGSREKIVKIWDVVSGKCVKILEENTIGVFSVSFSPDGKQIVAGGKTRTIWNVVSGKCEKVLRGHICHVWSVSFSPDGKEIASGSIDKTVRICNVSGKGEKKFEGHTNEVWSVSFSPDGTLIASGSADKTIRIWDTMGGKHKKELERHTSYVNSIMFSHDGKQIASTCRDRIVRIWDVVSGKYVKVLKGHTDHVRSVLYSPNGKQIASGSLDTTVKIWNVINGRCEKELKGHTGVVWSVSFSPDGNRIASGSADKKIRIWNVVSGKCEIILEGHTDDVFSVSFSPDGKQIVSGGIDETVRIWGVLNGKCAKVLEGHTHYVYTVSFSPDGKQIASGSRDEAVRIWDAVSGKCEKVLRGHTSFVWSVSFSPDGKQIASGSFDRTVRIWDVWNGKCAKVLEGHINFVHPSSFSLDGKQIVSGGWDRTVRIWDTVSGKCVKMLKGHTDSVNSISFSPDGTQIVSGSEDKTIRIWDIVSGKCDKVLQGQTRNELSLSFSPNGDGNGIECKHFKGFSLDGVNERFYFNGDKSICCCVCDSNVHILRRLCN